MEISSLEEFVKYISKKVVINAWMKSCEIKIGGQGHYNVTADGNMVT